MPGGLAVSPWTSDWLAVAGSTPASVTFCPGPVPSRGLARGGGLGRRVAGRLPGSGGRPRGTTAADRVDGRVLAATPAGHGGALGRYGPWPPAGTRARAGCRLPRPFCEVAVFLATVAWGTAVASLPVIGCLCRTGRPGPVGLDPSRRDGGRPGPGDVSGCPAGPDVSRCCAPEKLSAPEQNSDAEGERREDAHGDRSVDQSQTGREHPGHQHRHRRNGQEGTGPDHVRPPTTRRGAPGSWLPAVV
jgi:hypothetical protein